MNPFGRGWKRHLPFLALCIPLLHYLLFSIYPSFMTVLYSFTDIKLGITGEQWHFAGWLQYEKIFFSSNSPARVKAMWKSLEFALEVTFIQIGLALWMAVLLNRRLVGRVLYRSIIFLPVVLGVTVCGLMWTLIFNSQGGIGTQVADWLSWKSAFFSDRKVAFQLVIGVQIWMGLGYSMLIFLSGLQSIPKELYEAAYMDGAKNRQTFRHITFPLIAPSFTVNVLLAIIGSLQTFDTILVLTKGKFDTQTLAYQVYGASFDVSAGQTTDQGLSSALAMVLFVFVFAFVVGLQIYLRKREVQV